MADEEKRLRLEYLPMGVVKHWPRNPKAHDFVEIGTSMSRWGYNDPIILDERTGRMVAGHGRLETLEGKRRAGEAPPDFVVLDPDSGEWLVPVVRGWATENDDEGDAYVLANNQITTAGGWDRGRLLEMSRDLLAKGVSFQGTGFDPKALAREARKALQEAKRKREEEGEAPENGWGEEVDLEPPEVPVTQPGDLWLLGEHRLLCGDSFSEADRGRLLDGDRPAMVATDPPFAIYGSSTGIGADIADDKMIRPFFADLFRIIYATLPTFAHCYLHCDFRTWATITHAAHASGMALKNCLVWDKGAGGLGSMWGHCHEFVYFGAKSPQAKAMKSTTARGERTVLGRDNVLRDWGRVTGADRLHNAAKPVTMIAEFMEASTDPGDIVADFFNGSGTVIMAGEHAGRRVRAMEMEPKWCDVTVHRWEKATGKKAERIPAGEGAPRPRRRKKA